MSTTASIYHKNFCEVMSSDGYPANAIKNIMKVKSNIVNGKGFNEDIDLSFTDTPDDTLNYKYVISDDGSELSIRGYESDDARVAVIDLNTLFEMYTQDEEAFQSWVSDASDYMEISTDDLQMETDEYMDKYDGNAFDWAYHTMAKCTVKRIEDIHGNIEKALTTV